MDLECHFIQHNVQIVHGKIYKDFMYTNYVRFVEQLYGVMRTVLKTTFLLNSDGSVIMAVSSMSQSLSPMSGSVMQCHQCRQCHQYQAVSSMSGSVINVRQCHQCQAVSSI